MKGPTGKRSRKLPTAIAYMARCRTQDITEPELVTGRLRKGRPVSQTSFHGIACNMGRRPAATRSARNDPCLKQAMSEGYFLPAIRFSALSSSFV